VSWLLLGLAVPVFIAFLTRKATKKETVSSLAIFEVLAAEVEPRRRFAVPHHLLALLLTLSALALAALAVIGVGGSDRDVVVVLDRSASMGADDGRWGDALSALDQVDGGRVALVSRGLIEPWTSDADALANRAQDWLPEGADHAERDLHLALSLQADEVLWITDGVGTPAVPESVRVVSVGGPVENLGLADVALRPVDGLGTSELQIVVANGTSQARAVDVSIEVDGALVEVVGLDVPAHGEASRVVRGTWSGAVMDLRLPAGDALSADDHVSVPLVAPTAVPVVLQTPNARSFIAEAITVHPRASICEDPCDDAPLAFVEGDLPLPDAATVVVFDGGAGDLEEPEVLRWAFDDPLFRFVDLGRLGLASATTVEGEPLIETNEGVIAGRDGHLIRFGFDLDDTDLPVRLAFVNLLANLVDQAAPSEPVEALGLLDGAESRMVARELAGAELSPVSSWTRWMLAAALVLLLLETGLPLLRRLRDQRERRRLGTRQDDEEPRLAV